MKSFQAIIVIKNVIGYDRRLIPKLLILSFLLLLPLPISSQTAGCVMDKITNLPVPLANIWVENEDIGTTSDRNGYFHFIDSLTNKYLIVTTLGYERRKIKIDTSFLQVFLEPRLYSIPEVIIKPKKEVESVIISYRKSKLFHYISSMNPSIYARHVPYKEEFQITPFIKSIKVETYSRIESAVFRLRLFKVNPDGKPGEDILKNDILVKVKRGRRSMVINDFNNSQIIFPKDGLFVALEFLMVKENEYEATFLTRETHKREKMVCYMPFFGTVLNQTPPTLYVYSKGDWKLCDGVPYAGISIRNKNEGIAVEVTLSN